MRKRRSILALVLALCLVFTNCIPVGITAFARAEATESDFENAQTISLDTPTDVSIEIPNTADYFKFIPAESGLYAFSADSGTDTYATLYDADHVSIDFNDDRCDTYDFTIYHSLVAGETYYFAAEYISDEMTGTFTVALKAIEIAALVVEDIELVEGSSLEYLWHTDEETGDSNQYTKYNYSSNASFYLVLTDGTQIYPRHGVIEIDNQGFAPQFSDDQSYENVWGVGSHTAHATMYDIETEFTVTITENPVSSISIDKTRIIENTSGEIYGGANSEEEYIYYWHYHLPVPKINVTLGDGSVVDNTNSDFIVIDGTNYYPNYHISQGSDSPWGVGEHIVKVEICGRTVDWVVEIVENPIERIEVEDMTVIEHTNGWMSTYAPGNDIYIDFFEYVPTPAITVYFKNASPQTITDYSEKITIYDQKFEPYIYIDQGPEELEIGTHTLEAEIANITGEFSFTIVESPITSVTADTAVIIEGTNQEYVNEYVDETQNYVQWYKYWYSLPPITFTLNDGQEIVIESSNSIEIDGEIYTFDIKDSQSYNSQWGVGTHEVYIDIFGDRYTIYVEIIDTPILSITTSTEIKFYEHTQNEHHYFTDPETGDTIDWYKYGYDTPELTVTFLDGTSQTSTDYVIYNGEYYWFSVSDDQTSTNSWGVGEHEVTVSVLNYTGSFTVEIVENPIASISAENMEISQFTGGCWESEYDEETGEYHDWYSYYCTNDAITVNFKDGGSTLVTDNGIVIDGVEYRVSYDYLQDYDNQWDIGEYTVEIELLGIKGTYTITITESPFESISATDIVFYEHLDGWYVEEWLEDNSDPVYWYLYDSFYNDYTVVYNGQTYTSNGVWIDIENKQYEIKLEHGQTYYNQWGIGEHTVTATLGPVSTTFTVTIKENPVSYIVAKDLKWIKDIDAGECGYYDEELGQEISWLEYNVWSEYTIYFKDGTNQTTTSYLTVDGEDYYVSVDHGQSSTNEWGVGVYQVTATFMGVETTYNVEIIETPVQSIEIEDVSCIVGTNGCFARDYIEETGEDSDWYYLYDVNPEITVYFIDGTHQVVENDCVNYNGREYSVYIADEQYYYNCWDIGEHEVSVSVLGASETFTVTITESPIESIVATDLKYVVGTNVSEQTYCDEFGEHQWYRYDISTYCTVYFKDGTSQQIFTILEYNGENYSTTEFEDQDYYNQWDVGEHTVTVYLLGVETTYTVEIIESPVESVVATNLTVYKGTNGYFTWHYDENEECYYKWYCYETTPEMIVYFSDGTHQVYDEGVEYEGEFYDAEIDDSQSYYNQWDVGQYEVTVSIMGVETTFTYEIVESTIENIVFDNLTVFSGKDSYMDGYYDEDDNFIEFGEVYNVFPSGTVYFTDGTYERFSNGYVEYNGIKYDVFVDDEEYYFYWEQPGDYQVLVHVFGFESTIIVTAYPAGPVLVEENGELIYYVDGEISTDNTLVKHTDGIWYHVNNGKWVNDTTLVKYGGTYYYVKNGVKSSDNTLVKYNGKWYHVNGGKRVNDTTLVKYGGVYYYVKDGVKCTDNTLVKYNGKWYHVNGGQWVKDTTLVKYTDGQYYYVKNGVKTADTTLVKYNSKWYYVKNGVYTKSTTLVKYTDGNYYYVKNGIKNTTDNTLVKYNGVYYHVKGGKWVKDTTLVKYNSKWYYVKNGKFDKTFNGKVKYGGKYYTVKNGIKV